MIEWYLERTAREQNWLLAGGQVLTVVVWMVLWPASGSTPPLSGRLGAWIAGRVGLTCVGFMLLAFTSGAGYLNVLQAQVPGPRANVYRAPIASWLEAGSWVALSVVTVFVILGVWKQVWVVSRIEKDVDHWYNSLGLK